FNFYVSSFTSAGSWMTVSPGVGCCETAPHTITVGVNTLPTLTAGTYSGQIVLSSQSGTVTMTVPTSLTVTSTSTAFLDNLPGQLSFSLKTGGTTITSQDIQIRNGGTGSLNWNLSTSTADGGNWLTASSTSGTAPSTVTVGVNVANLPSAGLVAG